MAEDRNDGGEGEVKVRGSQDAAAEKEKTKVTSDVAEKAEGELNPSSPGNTGTTPGTNARVG